VFVVPAPAASEAIIEAPFVDKTAPLAENLRDPDQHRHEMRD
jgi:hypothetical protein